MKIVCLFSNVNAIVYVIAAITFDVTDGTGLWNVGKFS